MWWHGHGNADLLASILRSVCTASWWPIRGGGGEYLLCKPRNLGRRARGNESSRGSQELRQVPGKALARDGRWGAGGWPRLAEFGVGQRRRQSDAVFKRVAESDSILLRTPRQW